MLTVFKVHVTHLFLSFPAFCCVHFLTFVSNSSTIQRPSTARTSFPLFPCAWIQFAAVVSVVSSSFLVSGCKVNTFIPNNQNNLVKKS